MINSRNNFFNFTVENVTVNSKSEIQLCIIKQEMQNNLRSLSLMSNILTNPRLLNKRSLMC